MLASQVVPRKILPMQAASAAPFDDPGYLYETKWDDCRGIVAIALGLIRRRVGGSTPPAIWRPRALVPPLTKII